MSKTSPKFIFVIGGVISGLGKGIFTASLAKLLKLYGYSLNPIKIDPYLNIDAGTMRPTEHGEVWVTYDGGEIDQDLGNYERFLEQKFSKNNNITSGKIFSQILDMERKGKFLGKTVQYIPHVTNLIEKILIKNHNKSKANITIVEIGGTVGDYESSLFFHTIARMQTKYNIAVVFMGYILYPPHLQELKTKPFQHALNNLFSYGIRPDLLVLRSNKEIDSPRIQKIANASGMPESTILPMPDTNNILGIPLYLNTYKTHDLILNKLKLQNRSKLSSASKLPMFNKNNKASKIKQYEKFIKKINILSKSNQTLKIALVGKYFGTGKFTLADSYISVIESLKYASYANNIKLDFEWIDSTKIDSNFSDSKMRTLLKQARAIVVPGGFGSTGVQGKIRTIRFARENKIPYLGLCYGLQLAVIEYARNILKLKKANTTEIDPETPYPVIDILPEQKKILRKKMYGATMRLGEYKAYLQPNTIVFETYKTRKRLLKDDLGYYVVERHRHRYEVNPDYHEQLTKNGLILSGMSADKRLVEFIELPKTKHPYFVATQAHPEFTSYPQDPNPLFWGLLHSALKNK